MAEPVAQHPGTVGDQSQEPALIPGNSPQLQQLSLRDRVLNLRRSKHKFRIPYDEAADADQTSRATHFLINIDHEFLWTRFKTFIGRPNFFDVNHPYNERKGCWTVRDKKHREISVTYKSETHRYSLNRLAVRLWHDERSILGLLSNKGYQVHTICHNGRCLNPDHIVVESAKDFNERTCCRRAGTCTRHKYKDKTDPDRFRKECIFQT